METYHKKSKIGRGNRFFRGLSKHTNHRFLQTRETVPLNHNVCRLLRLTNICQSIIEMLECYFEVINLSLQTENHVLEVK